MFSSHVNLAVLHNGEFDMWDLVEKGGLIDAMIQFFGASHEARPDIYGANSSVQRVTAITPTTLLLHGTKDLCVSHEPSIAYAEALRSKGVHAEVEIFEVKPHVWFNKEPDRTVSYRWMEKFLVEQFGL